MSQVVATPEMTGNEMVALCRQHSLYEWSVQGAVDPIPVARAQGVHFWTPEGKRYIDFNSQLMCVNAAMATSHHQGHRDPAASLAYANPFVATSRRPGSGKPPRSRPAIDVFFFTNGGAGRTKTPSASPAPSPAGTRSWRALPRLPRQHCRRPHALGITRWA
jgi:taurine--2-oxoglutarate transaminase